MLTIVKPDELTDDQRKLLLDAHKNRGRLVVVAKSESRGRAVFGKDEKFYDRSDRSVAQRYLRGVSELESMQLLRQERPTVYELTNIGWHVSRKIHE